MADRKRKGKAVSLSSQVPKFKTPYHEAHYKAKLSARKVFPELIIQVDESILDPCDFQIQQRKWERFTNPIQAVGHLMVKEFYANAWKPDKEKRKPYTYTTMVRGKDISFAPSNIKRVKLRKDPLPNAASYHERKANKDYRLEHVLEDLCIEGGDWVRHKDGRPYYLRRADVSSRIFFREWCSYTEDEDYVPDADEMASFDDHIDNLFADHDAEEQNNRKRRTDNKPWEVDVIEDGVIRPLPQTMFEANSIPAGRKIVLRFDEYNQAVG
ncbi:hypothetical protein PIB30_060606 [Stylosanthes scabra]|uniref:Putative plant transposon protein domain-containing protein n=1 Tax=Stylosanthes scabra TaxID=79078 RepID=A0ABU6SKL6_9FABA|nr:hypothetical protein [Stylosanthes scabra]